MKLYTLLKRIIGELTPPKEFDLTLLDSWVRYNSSIETKASLTGNLMVCTGTIKGGSVERSTQIFQLPDGYVAAQTAYGFLMTWSVPIRSYLCHISKNSPYFVIDNNYSITSEVGYMFNVAIPVKKVGGV